MGYHVHACMHESRENKRLLVLRVGGFPRKKQVSYIVYCCVLVDCLDTAFSSRQPCLLTLILTLTPILIRTRTRQFDSGSIDCTCYQLD